MKKKCWFLIICGLGKAHVRLSIWTQLCSITTISNTGAFNYYASTAHEPNWLKSIVKFSIQTESFAGVRLGVGTSKLCKKLCLKYLLISKKNSAPALAVQKKIFGGLFGKVPKRWYSKLCQSFCPLNIYW